MQTFCGSRMKKRRIIYSFTYDDKCIVISKTMYIYKIVILHIDGTLRLL